MVDWLLVIGLGCEVRSIAENSSEKALDNAPKTRIERKQNNECQYKKEKKADKNFQYFEYQPKRNQAGQEDKKWIFKQIVHGVGKRNSILGYWANIPNILVSQHYFKCCWILATSS